jgi:hypothetical protein
MIELRCKCGTTEVTVETYYALPNLKCNVCTEQKQVRAKAKEQNRFPDRATGK